MRNKIETTYLLQVIQSTHFRLEGMGTEVGAIAVNRTRLQTNVACDGIATLRRSLIGARGEELRATKSKKVSCIMAQPKLPTLRQPALQEFNETSIARGVRDTKNNENHERVVRCFRRRSSRQTPARVDHLSSSTACERLDWPCIPIAKKL
jgi:hypothetical protein